jgi:hypothetical protein
MAQQRRFPAPWSAEIEPNCFIVRDADGQALSYVFSVLSDDVSNPIAPKHGIRHHCKIKVRGVILKLRLGSCGTNGRCQRAGTDCCANAC